MGGAWQIGGGGWDGVKIGPPKVRLNCLEDLEQFWGQIREKFGQLEEIR